MSFLGSGIQDIVGDVTSIRGMFKKQKTPRSSAKPRYVDVPSFKRGGKMKRSGVAKLHKGERIKGRRRSR